MKSFYLLSFLLHALLLLSLVYYAQLKPQAAKTLVVRLHKAPSALAPKTLLKTPPTTLPKAAPTTSPKIKKAQVKKPKSPPKLNQISTDIHAGQPPELDNSLGALTQLENAPSLSDNFAIQPTKSSGQSPSRVLKQAVQDKKNYKQALAQAIRKHWKISKQEDFVREILLEVALQPSGKIGKIQLKQSSGNPEIDKATNRAVLLAAPFPAHPKSFPKNQDFLILLRFFPENLVLE